MVCLRAFDERWSSGTVESPQDRYDPAHKGWTESHSIREAPDFTDRWPTYHRENGVKQFLMFLRTCICSELNRVISEFSTATLETSKQARGEKCCNRIGA